MSRLFSKGFSLVELLVVIVIISIALTLLFPLSGRMREGALRIGCVNNLRTIGSAITSFSIEHKGRVPGPSWETVEIAKDYAISGMLKNYLEAKMTDSVWECPANPKIIARNKTAAKSNVIRYASYVTHYPYFGYTFSPPKESPAPMLLSDIKEKPRPEQWLLRDIDSWNYNMPERIGGTYPPVHSIGRNHLFPDMTVEWVKVKPQ